VNERGVFYAIKMTEVEGYVWCDRHGCVHDDSLNPYGYAESVPGNDLCDSTDHRPMYVVSNEA